MNVPCKNPRLEQKVDHGASALPVVQVQILDVACLDSVRKFASSWQQRPLHILVNNAGMFTMGGKMCNIQAHWGIHYQGSS